MIIVANGVIESKTLLLHWAGQADLVIAVDGGADYCLAAGIVPDRLIGDLDSVSESVLKTLKSKGKKIIAYSAEKDFTDLELALQHAVDLGGTELVILGALGARWDMSVANLMLLGADFLKEKKVRMVVENQEAVLLRPKEELSILGAPGDVLSLIPLGGDAEGISTSGLRYRLDREPLAFTATKGVSNQLISHEANVRLESGMLLCIHQRISADPKK